VDVGKVWKLNVLWLVEGEITKEFYQQKQRPREKQNQEKR
jgi:hypothetical protein